MHCTLFLMLLYYLVAYPTSGVRTTSLPSVEGAAMLPSHTFV